MSTILVSSVIGLVSILIILSYLYKWIKQSYKNQPTGIAKIQLIIAFVALLALLVSGINLYLNIFPPIKQPNLAVKTELVDKDFTPTIENSNFDLYIYNGGNAPCFGLRLITSSNLLVSEYTNQDLVRTEYKYKDGSFYKIMSPIARLTPYRQESDKDYYTLEFIKEGEVKSYSISVATFMASVMDFKVLCEGSESNTQIKLLR
ncbi:MAG: hypothetical protein Q8R00_00240 [Candidatus Nanoarchaeia archaeon]|nr:hypothetical protein [Candidatus Nanoarchaeia archaeon]